MAGPEGKTNGKKEAFKNKGATCFIATGLRMLSAISDDPSNELAQLTRIAERKQEGGKAWDRIVDICKSHKWYEDKQEDAAEFMTKAAQTFEWEGTYMQMISTLQCFGCDEFRPSITNSILSFPLPLGLEGQKDKSCNIQELVGKGHRKRGGSQVQLRMWQQNPLEEHDPAP